MRRGVRHWTYRASNMWVRWSIGCMAVPFILFVGGFVPALLQRFIEAMLSPFLGLKIARAVSIVGLLIVPMTLIWLAFSTMLYNHKKRQEVSRIRDGLCRKCGYDVRENSDRCPECGALILREVPADLADWDRR